MHRTMGFPATFKTVPFYNTLESTSLARAADLNLIPDLHKLSKLYFLTKLIDFRISNPEFLHVIKSAFGGSLAMTGLWFIQPCFLFGAETDLNGIIAIFGLGLFLKNHAWTCFNYCHRYSLSLFRVNTGHPNLFTQQSHCIRHCTVHSLH